MVTVTRGGRPPSLTLPFLLDLLQEAQAIDAGKAREILQLEERLKLKFLREKYGASGAKKRHHVAPTEIVEFAKLPHPEAPGRFIDQDILAQLLAQASGVPYKKIDMLELDIDLVTRALPKGFARRHMILPLAKGHNQLTVAIFDPYNTAPLEEFSRATGVEVAAVVSSKRDIMEVITNQHGFHEAVKGAKGDATTRAVQNLEQLVKVRTNEEIDPGDQKIVAAVEYILNAAFDNRASDIHIEPKRELSRLRLRIDGVLHTIVEVPAAVHPALAARIKVLARMDIAEKRRPQDGRIKSQRGRARDRASCLLAPDRVWRKDRHPNLRPAGPPRAVDRSRLHAKGARQLRNVDPPAERSDLDHRADGQREDHDDLLDAQISRVAEDQHRHRRRSDRNGLRAAQPGFCAAEDRCHLCPRSEDDPASGPRHHHGRRDPGRGDGIDDRAIRADRTPGLFDAAHQRHRCQRRANDRARCRAVFYCPRF